ncbi:MAG: hypothetical protein KatS3mg056_0266 [Chloroflexus sp.]|nr:MAG: hypothetical protein KatS3mg056_0266 [Chloroflexus sp.]
MLPTVQRDSCPLVTIDKSGIITKQPLIKSVVRQS